MLTKTDLNQIRGVVREEVDVKLKPVTKDLKYLKKKVNRINKTVDIIVKNYDEADVKLDRRVRKIENHLGFVQP